MIITDNNRLPAFRHTCIRRLADDLLTVLFVISLNLGTFDCCSRMLVAVTLYILYTYTLCINVANKHIGYVTL